MGRDKNRFSRVGIGAQSILRKKCAASIGRFIVQNALLLGTVFMFSMFSSAGAWASNPSAAVSGEDSDARWLPWIGSWHLVSGVENSADSALKDQYLLTTSPGESGNSIIMRGHRAEQVLFQEEIEADGLRRPIKKNDCTGWQSYGWSDTGKRLLFEGELGCPGDIHQAVSGISIIDGNGDWLDIQLLQSDEEKTITVRRYRNIDTDTIAPGRTSTNPSRIARISAGAGFSIDEVIELSEKVDPAVLEAALAEMHKPFPINSKQILHLADSGVSTRIVDLMVALSFPDEFVVEKAAISRVQRSTPLRVPLDILPYNYYWSCFHPMFSWYWATSYYSLYDGWYLDRYYWPGWHHASWWYHSPGWYNSSLWYYSPWWSPGHGGSSYGVDTGRLVEGQGYTRVYQDNGNSPVRYARPRNAATSQSSVNRKASSTSSSSSTAVIRSTSTSGSVGASPSGYSSGNSSWTEDTSNLD